MSPRTEIEEADDEQDPAKHRACGIKCDRSRITDRRKRDSCTRSEAEDLIIQ
jgi:hypothetical protein